MSRATTRFLIHYGSLEDAGKMRGSWAAAFYDHLVFMMFML
jgi:hypothetical protein